MTLADCSKYLYNLLKLDRLGKQTYDVLDEKIDRLIGEDCDIISLMKSTVNYTLEDSKMQDKLIERLQIIDGKMGSERFAFG